MNPSRSARRTLLGAGAVATLVFSCVGAITPAAARDPVRYLRYDLSEPGRFDALVDSLGAADFANVLLLNRIDLAHAREAGSLIVPSPVPDRYELSPFPTSVPDLRRVPKVLLVSLRTQAWAAYRHGVLERWGPTSTGGPAAPTPAGLYFTNWKSRERNSTDDESWVLEWYFNFDSLTGCAIHVYDLPGRPASHSCVRMTPEDAEWVYYWADQWIMTPDEQWVLQNGTPLLVFGTYDFTAPPPWHRLPEEPNVLRIPLEEIDAALRRHATSDDLASLSPDGIRLGVEIEGVPAPRFVGELHGRYRRHPDFRFLHYEFLARLAHFVAPAQRRVDFDSLRAAIDSAGGTPASIHAIGFGRAQYEPGGTLLLNDDGEVLYVLQNRAAPESSRTNPVPVRYRGIVGERGIASDTSSVFRIDVEQLRVGPPSPGPWERVTPHEARADSARTAADR